MWEKEKKKGVTTSIIETKGKKKLPLLPIDNSTKKASKQFSRSFKKRQKMPEGSAKKAVMLGFFAHKNPKWVVVNDFRMVTYLDIHSHFLPNIASLVFARFAKCVVKMKEKPLNARELRPAWVIGANTLFEIPSRKSDCKIKESRDSNEN